MIENDKPSILIEADYDSYMDALPLNVRIHLDGNEITDVLAFSEQDGWADQLDRNGTRKSNCLARCGLQAR